MLKTRSLPVLISSLLFAAQAFAQQPKTVTGKVTSDAGQPLPGVSVIVRGADSRAITNPNGDYSIRAAVGQVLQYRLIGYGPVERTVGEANAISVTLEKSATNLDALVVTALGQTAVKRSLGTAQQTVTGPDIAQTGRENFINALQGRVAGVEVTSSSGVPGASTSITIRGVSSISGSNQPLMIIDGLPMDNKTMNSAVLGSDAPGSATAFNNRGVDFTNRGADVNPEDIETLVVLKGPEAAALYGIDAANGAIVITTKRGKPGTGAVEYSNNIRMDRTRLAPEVQNVYSLTPNSTVGFQYFGLPYAAGTQFYDNIDGFFKPAVSQQHNLAISGGSSDAKLGYRIAASAIRQGSVIPTAGLDRINLTGATNAQVTKWLKSDLSMAYSNQTNDQVFKGDGGPLIGLLLWPATDKASDWLTPAGTRRRVTNLAQSAETDNPYFAVNRNKLNAKTSRLIANLGFTITPFSWGTIRSNIGSDSYTNENLILRHPESAAGSSNNGILDITNDVVRNINMQNLFNVNRRTLPGGITVEGLLGQSLQDARSLATGDVGRDFYDLNFISMNNTDPTKRFSRTTLSQRRLLSAFGQATFGFHDYLFATVTGRNDWTSTIPVERNSFFYPGVNGSFIVTDAFPSLLKYMTSMKLRGGYAAVGKDARPYAYRPSLESKTTTGGGYGYGFTGPNLGLKPEFKISNEFGAEMSFLRDRLGVDITRYKSETRDQIVNDIRGSYGTGFILFNLNGAKTRNNGVELQVRGTPVLRQNGSWDVMVNWDKTQGKTIALPNALPESYVSDTWLFGNVRNGTAPGQSTRSLTGLFYLRNNAGDLLIDPTTGLPIRSAAFIAGPGNGYDRQPDWTMGITNTIKYKRFSLNFLVDIRKGGDVFNATEQFLTARGLSKRTLDREQPRIVAGVLRDGKENTATPTKNTITVIPMVQPAYYTAISEELFIEKNINWVRLKDITLRYTLPPKVVGAKSASVFITGTDLFLFTNYSGLDPIVNGNTAAVGGSGASGIDYGNFPMPRGVSFGLKVGY
jgi:TonB-linked SusC/RagA family outer membrane protein